MRIILIIFGIGLSFSLAAKMKGEATAPALIFFQSQNLNSVAMNKKEIWKDVSEYEGYYMVSNTGKIKSIDRQITRLDGKIKIFKGKHIKTRISQHGYEIVTLSKRGERKHIRVHRLVAIAFINNPQNKSQINHKNGVKTDNMVDNLEWTNRVENMQHAFNSGLYSSNEKEVLQIDANTDKIIKKYKSQSDAARSIKGSNKSISNCCRGKSKTAHGFKWRTI